MKQNSENITISFFILDKSQPTEQMHSYEGYLAINERILEIMEGKLTKLELTRDRAACC